MVCVFVLSVRNYDGMVYSQIFEECQIAEKEELSETSDHFIGRQRSVH